jgi:hypothetical protein
MGQSMISECPCGCVLVPHPPPTKTFPMPFHDGKVKLYYSVISVVKGSLIKTHLKAVIGEQDSRKPSL